MEEGYLNLTQTQNIVTTIEILLARALKTKNVFALEAVYKKGDFFKCPKVFHCDN